MAANVARLKERLADVTSGRVALTLGVWAEAGAGKSHAVATALRELSCRSLTVHATAAPVALARQLPNAPLPAWATQNVQALLRGSSLTEDATVNALAAWLEAIAPFVLHVEDLHEASSETRQFWCALGAAASRAPGVGVVVTSRTPPPKPFEALALERLDFAATTAMLTREAGASLPEDGVRWIFERTQGNPLYSLEFFRWLARFGHLWSDGQRWRWREPQAERLPTRVEALVAQSLEVAVRDARRRDVLLAAALLGASLTAKHWASVAGVTAATLKTVSQDLERSGIFRHGTFAHPLFREVLLESSSPSERTRLARNALEVLAMTDPIRAADVLDWAQLDTARHLEYLDAAVRHALKRNDPLTAARLRWRAVRLAPRHAQVALLLEGARWARPYRLEESFEALVRARALEPHNPDVLRLLLEVMAWTGRGREALALLSSLTEQLRSDPSWLETRALLLHRGFDYAGLMRFWEHELESRHVTSPVVARALARAFVHFKRFDDAQNVIARGLKLPRLTDFERAQLQYAAAFIPNAKANFASSISTCSELIAEWQPLASKDPRYLELLEGAHQLRAYAASALGCPRDAITDLEQCLRLQAQMGNAPVYAQRQSELGFHTLESGDFERAETLLLEARGVLERVDQPLYNCYLERFTALLHLHRGQAALALRHAHAAVREANDVQDESFTAGALHTLAWVEAVLGSPQRALTTLEQRSPVDVLMTPSAVLVQALALERLGQSTRAITLLEEAAQQEARVYFECSPERIRVELARMRGDRDAAVALLRELEASGQGLLASRVRQAFPDLDATPVPPASPPALEVLGPIRWRGETIGERGRKGNELLAYLLEARVEGRDAVPSEELFEVLYPNTTDAQATAALKQQVYRLRGVLGADAILRHADGYALGSFDSDLERYLATPRAELWRGAYLADLGVDHPSELRDRLVNTLREHVLQLTSTDKREALRLARILLEMDAYDLETLRLTLHAALEAGDTLSAIHAYASARARLEEIGESLPDSWQVFLEPPTSSAP
jgi:tetratricopeptide (TPR) repeat protein